MKILFYFANACTTIRNLSLLSLTLLLSQNVSAQTTDRINFYQTQLGESNGVSTSTTSGRVAHQFFLDDEGSNLLTASVNFHQTQITDEDATGDDESRTLQAVMPTFNLMRIINEEYSLIAILRTGFFGDVNADSGGNFRVEGGAVITKYMSDKLTMGIGLARGTNLGRDLVVPLVQFLYFATDKIVVRGLLPVRASAWYIPNQTWEYGLTFSLNGSLYNVEGTTDVPDAEQLGFATANIGASTRYRVKGNNFLVAEAGFTALRRYEFVENDGPSMDIGKEPLFDKDLDNTGYLKIGYLNKF